MFLPRRFIFSYRWGYCTLTSVIIHQRHSKQKSAQNNSAVKQIPVAMTMVTMITHILSFKSKYGIALSIMIERAAYKIKNQSAGESN